MVDEDQGGAGIAPPGQYAGYVGRVSPGGWHMSEGFEAYLRSQQVRWVPGKVEPKKSLQAKIAHQIWYWRGRLSDWIAPEGWNDE